MTEHVEPPIAVNAPTFEGHNIIQLNEATMKQVVQFWLSHKWAGATPYVDSVGYDSSTRWFRVSLAEKPDA